MWKILEDGSRKYRGGRNDWSGAANEALRCEWFREDVEEEWVADEARSCYNCRYRRWTEDSFVCIRSRDAHKN
ncbi:MAG TPA: hypothetical protein PLI53_02140 [Geobacteraceae bacterium]|nr:hypothetical protein [Geobacteraceae bacterium]